MNDTRPYDLGMRAGMEGTSALSCPFAAGSPERRAWLRGFTAGLEAFRRGRVHGGKLTGFGVVNGFWKSKPVGRT